MVKKCDRKQALAAGFDHHLIKPVDAKKLAFILHCDPIRFQLLSGTRLIATSLFHIAGHDGSAERRALTAVE